MVPAVKTCKKGSNARIMILGVSGISSERFQSLDLEARLFISRTFWEVPAGLGERGWSRLFASVELAKNKKGVPYSFELGYFPYSWIYAKLFVNGINDLPTHPNGEDFLKWNASFTLTSEGSNLILRSRTDKSLNFTVGYGQTESGRNSGVGSEILVSMALIY